MFDAENARINREHLLAALRDPTKRPEGFEWDYSECKSCAIGLAFRLGLTPRLGSEPIARALNLPWESLDPALFFAMETLGVKNVRDVTPERVASIFEQIFTDFPVETEHAL